MNNLNNKKICVLNANEITDILKDRELEIIDILSGAYQCHGLNDDFLPHSVFIKFPNSERNRIIGLPAYLGGQFQKSGIKWITSYPDNHNLGLDRASAVVILNSFETGRPIALMEGSIISAKRTAGGAALAARHLVTDKLVAHAGLIGCGLLNFEIFKFLRKEFPSLGNLSLYDVNRQNAEKFKDKVESVFSDVRVRIADDVQKVIRENLLISLATNSVKPHIDDLSECPPGATILHISLRDLTETAVEAAVNIVDDVSHVCRARTSVHQTEEKLGSRDFIRGSLPDILLDRLKGRENNSEKIIFSPFGLGILDIALSDMVYRIAEERQIGQRIDSFFPDYWLDRQ